MPKTKSKTQTWEERISKQLVGRKIVEVRWMTPEEANESYWDYQPVLLILDDGTASVLCLTMKETMQGHYFILEESKRLYQ